MYEGKHQTTINGKIARTNGEKSSSKRDIRDTAGSVPNPSAIFSFFRHRQSSGKACAAFLLD